MIHQILGILRTLKHMEDTEVHIQIKRNVYCSLHLQLEGIIRTILIDGHKSSITDHIAQEITLSIGRGPRF